MGIYFRGPVWKWNHDKKGYFLICQTWKSRAEFKKKLESVFCGQIDEALRDTYSSL